MGRYNALAISRLIGKAHRRFIDNPMDRWIASLL
jgi:hypothetical protein